MTITEEDLSKAVIVFRRAATLTDRELHSELVEEGLDRRAAARLIEFLPSCYCRILLRNSGCVFSEEYERRSPDQPTKKYFLSVDPIWNVSLIFATKEATTASKNDLLVIAARSAEFEAINRLLTAGSKLSDLRLTPLVFTWGEQGPN